MDNLLRYGIFACFFTLILTPFGLPIPEEISLLVCGIVVKQGAQTWPVGWMVGFAGVTIGDIISWGMGRSIGMEPRGFMARRIGKDRIENIELFYERWGNFAIVIARMLPGMRMPTFFFAGASGVPLWRFFLIDATAALVTVNIFFWLGYSFADEIPLIHAWILEFRFYATILGFLLLVLAIYHFSRKRKKRKLREEA
jgi:membrane protein DedA with SNARE-associated domain